MIKAIAGLLLEFQKIIFSEAQQEIRKEADYIAQTLGDGIRRGFEDGFSSIKTDLSKLMVATFSVILGILLISYGLAVFIDSTVGTPGIGFMIMGLLGLILGLFTSLKE